MNIVEYAKMRKMFGGGSGGDIDALIDGSLTEITSNAESVSHYVFYRSKLKSANLPNAKEIGNYAFQWATEMTEVNMPSVETIGSYAFSNATALLVANFPNVTKVGDRAFEYCKALTEVNMPLTKSIGSATSGAAFYSCAVLTKVNLPSLTHIYTDMFNGCTALTSIRLPNVIMIGSTYVTNTKAFRECTALAIADFPILQRIASYDFQNCTALTALILRSETLASLYNTNSFTSTPIANGTGYIYVPRTLIEDYKIATNWVTFADQFRALEDYTVDGTTTGELDESKVSL